MGSQAKMFIIFEANYRSSSQEMKTITPMKTFDYVKFILECLKLLISAVKIPKRKKNKGGSAWCKRAEPSFIELELGSFSKRANKQARAWLV